MAAAAKSLDVLRLMKDPFALTPGFEGPLQPSGLIPEYDVDAGVWAVPFVMAMDNPLRTDWRGRARQTLGRIKLRRYLARISRVIVPGERSWQYARFLGFAESRIRRGNYGADAAAFLTDIRRFLEQPMAMVL